MWAICGQTDSWFLNICHFSVKSATDISVPTVIFCFLSNFWSSVHLCSEPLLSLPWGDSWSSLCYGCWYVEPGLYHSRALHRLPAVPRGKWSWPTCLHHGGNFWDWFAYPFDKLHHQKQRETSSNNEIVCDNFLSEGGLMQPNGSLRQKGPPSLFSSRLSPPSSLSFPSSDLCSSPTMSFLKWQAQNSTRVWAVPSPVPWREGQSLPWFCWLCYFWYKDM